MVRTKRLSPPFGERFHEGDKQLVVEYSGGVSNAIAGFVILDEW
jgi:hypothetical protein